MEKKRFILAAIVATGVFILWVRVVAPQLQKRGWFSQPEPQKQVVDTTAPGGTSASTPPAAATTTQPGQPMIQPVATGPQATSLPENLQPITARPVPGEIAADRLVLGSIDPQSPYRLRVDLTARGAAVRQATLTEYFDTTRRQSHYAVIDPDDYVNRPAALAVEQARLLGQTVDLAGPVWRLADEQPTIENGQAVRLVATLVQGGRPLVDIFKTYTLKQGGYELGVQYDIVSHLPAAVEVGLTGAGVVLPDQEYPRDDRRAVWGLMSADQQQAHTKAEGRQKIVQSPDAVKIPSTTAPEGAVWAAVENKFFASVLRPLNPRQQTVDFSLTPLGNDPANSRFRLGWKVEKLAVTPGQATTLAFSDFVGPKDRSLFRNDTNYVRLDYEGLINYGSCTWCIFKPLVSMMIWLLNVLHVVALGNYGVAIMLLVAIVRVLLHPLTKKSQIAMSKMSKLQPKLDELKKKYGDNKEELNKAMAEFYRQEGFSPMLGCLPMLLQMPIWIALWGGLNASIELRHAPFMLWINDLAAPDALWQWTTPAQGYMIPLIGGLTGPIYALNLLPILLAGAMFAQQYLTPRTTTGPQAQQQKVMMYFMTVFFALLFYGMPSGLTLYVMASTAVGAGEQYVIRKHIREQEEAEKRGELPRKEKPKKPSSGRGKRR